MSVKCIQIFEEKTGVQWTGITFHKQEPLDSYPRPMQAARFCAAVAEGRKKAWTLTPDLIYCEGAKRCFGWLEGTDKQLASKLANKTGLEVQTAYKIIQQVPVLTEDIAAISVGTDLEPDVLITYTEPEVVMRLIRFLQGLHGQNIPTELSSVMAVCGNVAVKSFISNTLAISFGCPDSREYGGIGSDKLVVGIPFKLIRHLNEEPLIRI